MATRPLPPRASSVADVGEGSRPRTSVRRCAVLKCDKTPSQQVIATEFTRAGCRVIIRRRVSVGTHVTLALPNLVEAHGSVAWSIDHTLGIDFRYALEPSVLAQIAGSGRMARG
jgi:hypothetical protein